MKVLRFIPVVLSFLILAAHLYRMYFIFISLLILIIPFLLFIKRAWVARIIQLILAAGATEWIRAMFQYISIRKETGEDWIRLAIILSAISLFTLLTALIFQTEAMKKIYSK